MIYTYLTKITIVASIFYVLQTWYPIQQEVSIYNMSEDILMLAGETVADN